MKENEFVYEVEVQSVKKNNSGSEYEYLIKIDIKDPRYKDSHNGFDTYLLLNEKWFQGEKFRISCEIFSVDNENKRNVYILKKRKCIIICQKQLVFLNVMKKLFDRNIELEDESFSKIYETWKKGEEVDINLLKHYCSDEAIQSQVVQNFFNNSEGRISQVMKFFKESKLHVCTQVDYFSDTISEFKHAYQLWKYRNTDLSMLDEIASNMQCTNQIDLFTERIKALLGYYIKERISKGTIYIPISEFYNSLSDYLLKQNANNQEDPLFKKLIIDKYESKELIYRGINDLVSENNLLLVKDKCGEEFVFTPGSYQILNDYNCAYSEYVKHVSPKYEILSDYQCSYSQEEINLFNQILMNDISIITGGPGTGKTTLCSKFIKCLGDNHPNLKIMVLATSGKAMQRLSQAVGKEGATIARFIFECKSKSKKKSINSSESNKTNNRRYYDCDIYIIEECSMLTLSDFTEILRNVPSYAKLILVGDPNQIPAIGDAAGSVFADLIQNNNNIFIKKLTKTYRQQEGSGIVDLARNIENPNIDANIFNENYWNMLTSMGITWIDTLSNNIYDELNKLLIFLLNHDIDFENVQAITPLNIGPLGSIQLNTQIQNKINNSKECYFNSRIASSFKYNDTIMSVKNNYSIQVFNGMRGFIVGKLIPSSRNTEDILCIHLEDGRRIECNGNDLIDFDLGYAMSVHKMQGSEAEIIIIIIDTTHINFWSRQLLYTAITRSKSQIYFLGQKKVFNQIILKEEDKRYTLLS